MGFGDVRAAAQEWKRGTFSPRVLAKMICAMGVPWMLTPREYRPMVAHIAQVVGWSELDVRGAIRIAGEHDFTRSTLKINHIQKLADEARMTSKRALELQILLAWCAQDSGRFRVVSGCAARLATKAGAVLEWQFNPYSSGAYTHDGLYIAERSASDLRAHTLAVRLDALPGGGTRQFGRTADLWRAPWFGARLDHTHEHLTAWVEARRYFDAHPELPCDLADPGMTPPCHEGYDRAMSRATSTRKVP